MAAVGDSKGILEGLTTNDCSIQLKAVENLKNIFNPPDKIFSQLKLESLLQSARTSLENRTSEPNFVFNYGMSILSFLGRDTTLDSEILHQLELILGEVKDEKLADELITKLWSRMEQIPVVLTDGVLNASKLAIERIVLEWVVDPSDSRMEFLSRLSAGSPKLFQSVTSILYEVLVKTRGHMRIFEVTSLFIEKLKFECQKMGKSCLVLYPKGCRRLVSLMRCPPELFSDGSEEVLTLLLEMFLTDRKRALILLSHFTDWVCIFKVHLGESDILT